MKKLKLCVLAIFCSSILFAQDQLFKKDNSKLEVKVLEITPTEIKYKLFNNLDGPQYVILKSEAALIIYKNGDHEAFKTAEAQPTQVPVYINAAPNNNSIDSFFIKKEIKKAKHYESVTKGKNVLFLNSLELIHNCLKIEYLHEFLNKTIEVHVPASFSLGEPFNNYYVGGNVSRQYNPYFVSNYKLNQKVFDVGLGLYVNTSRKKIITHFIGPLFRFAQFNGSYDANKEFHSGIDTSGWYGGYYSYWTTETIHFTLKQTYVMINNGFLYRFTPHFNMMINLALGFVSNRHYASGDPAKNPSALNNRNEYLNYSNATNSTKTLAVQLGFCFGYRF